MSDKNLIAEARAKLIWGESSEQVRQYLKDNGVYEQQVDGFIKMIQDERHAEIRAAGRGKIFSGILLGFSPVAVWFISVWLGFLFIKIFAVTIVIALFGVWRIVSGVLMLFAPQAEKGDLSKL